ncbi:MAG: hypothetical protein HYX84_02580 [Chloroflexi bacterium]|nr:hypothetical protein [Chloroflexota bacterium]
MAKKNKIEYQWALPADLKIPPDELQARLDFYQDMTILHLIEKDAIVTRVVSARDVALALLREVPLGSGLLPDNVLWWQQGKRGAEVALWRGPKVWPVALQLEAFKPPRQFKLPMPGLLFICVPGREPRVYSTKKRPRSLDDAIFHAPLFNVFHSGDTCPGTHKYPDDVGQTPESFFLSFFSLAGNHRHRSQRYPDNLLALWEELDGKNRYPLGDLMPCGHIKDIMAP